MKNWYRILILFLVSSSLLTFTAAAQQKNTDTERALVLKLAAYLKDSSYIKNTIRQIETEKKVETQITGYQNASVAKRIEVAEYGSDSSGL